MVPDRPTVFGGGLVIDVRGGGGGVGSAWFRETCWRPGNKSGAWKEGTRTQQDARVNLVRGSHQQHQERRRNKNRKKERVLEQLQRLYRVVGQVPVLLLVKMSMAKAGSLAFGALIASTVSAMGADCPCTEPSLCDPVTRTGPENVYAFHTTGTENWKYYDWSLITTICVFGELDPNLLCHAHANGARVTFGSGGLTTDQWRNETAVDDWVNQSVTKVISSFADGFNIDIEYAASDPDDIAALTAIAKRAADAMHAVNPHSHVTFDVPSEGLVQEGCGQQYGRNYDFKGLADALDFLVVMDYDSNDAHAAVGADQHFLPRTTPVYIYENRSVAEQACVDANFKGLCSKDDINGFSMCADGWCSDFKGYWMATKQTGCGEAGYNEDGPGPAGAYCCGGGDSEPCSTCFFANAALPVVSAGVDCFANLSVPADKLVLAFPWYGYDYTCAPGSTNLNECHVTSAVQVSSPQIQSLLAQSATGELWLDNSSTPYFGYNDISGALHRVDFDNSRSLRMKYELARNVGALGVGMWTASGLNYTDNVTAKQFWDDLKVFRPSTARVN